MSELFNNKIESATTVSRVSPRGAFKTINLKIKNLRDLNRDSKHVELSRGEKYPGRYE